MRIVHLLACAAAIVGLGSCPVTQGKSVKVVASSTGDGETVTVNGKRVEPGEFDTDDGVHVRYFTSGSGSNCKSTSVRVRSVSSGAESVSVEEHTSCSDGEDDDFDIDGIRNRMKRDSERIRREEFSDSDSSGASGRTTRRSASASASSEDRAGRSLHRDVLDRRFFDVEDLVRVIGAEDEEDDEEEEMLPTRRRGPRPGFTGERRQSNSGTGKPGEKRRVTIDEDGARARASTSGNGPHHERVTVRRGNGGTRVRASASSSSHGGH